MESNIVPHSHIVKKENRQQLKKHKAVVLWFTGLSGSGKSSISNKVEQFLFEQGYHTYLLDGDNIRTGLNKGLGFSEEDRSENLRRIAEVCKLFIDAGVIVLGAFVSPLKRDRELIKTIIGKENFVEIFVNTSLDECERRDVKGLYKKARAGEIKNFTGINAPYESPDAPDIEIRTDSISIVDSANLVVNYLNDTLKLKDYE